MRNDTPLERSRDKDWRRKKNVEIEKKKQRPKTRTEKLEAYVTPC